MKPLLPPPPEAFGSDAPIARPLELARASTPAIERPVAAHEDPMAEAVRDEIANAEPEVAAAMRELIAAQVVAAPRVTSESVKAVITESAEAVYINERRDTIEAPPLSLVKVEPIAAKSDTTESVAVRIDEPTAPAVVAEPVAEAVTDAPTDAVAVVTEPIAEAATDAHDDRVAAERGVAPIRVPTRSTAFVPLRAISSRKIVIGSISIAAVSLCVAAGAIVYARGAIADSKAAQTPLVDVEQPAQPESPALAPAITPIAAPTMASTQPASGICSVTVRASSDGAIVWLDGKARGLAPQTLTGVCNAAAVIEVRHPRYADFKQDLVLTDGLEVVAKLERETTELTVWSDPPGAEVTYEGRVIGKTPLETSVHRFEQGQLNFRAPGYEPDWRRIVPKQAKKTVSITLKKAR